MSTINDQTDPEDQPIRRGELDALLANNDALQATRREEMRREIMRQMRREMDERLGDGSQTEDSEREALLPNNNIRLLQAMNDLAGAAIEAHVQEHTPRRQEHIVQHDREETEQMRLGGREEDPNLLSGNAQIIQALNIAPLEDPPVDRRGVEEDIEFVAIGVVARPPNRYLSMAGRLLGMGSVSPRRDLNTGTLGLCAVAVVVHPSARTTHRIRAWLTAVGLLLFVLLEIVIFTAVISESAYPKCHAVNDCAAGTYCRIFEDDRPAFCNDCINAPRLDENKYNEEDIDENDDEYYPNVFDDTCSKIFTSEIWENRDYTINVDYNKLPMTPPFNPEAFEWTRYKCLANHHCSETDMDAPEFDEENNRCDFIAHNKQKMDVQIWILLFVLSLLWTLPVCQEIEEASIEEIVLNHHVGDTLDGPAEVVRVALRIRRFIVPLMATSSTIVLLITDTLSSFAVILNFLAIAIILEADNVVAVLFLNNHRNEIMDDAVRDVDGSVSGAARGSFFWTRIQGLLCAIILVSAMNRIEQYVTACEYLQWFLYTLILWPALIIFTGQFIYSVVCTRRNGSSVGEEIILALTEYFRNLLALSMALYISDIIEMIQWGLGASPVLVRVIKFTFDVEDIEGPQFFVPTIVAFLMVVGLSMLRRRWYGRAVHEQTEHTDQHRAEGGNDQAV